jgi:hypothetical protein
VPKLNCITELRAELRWIEQTKKMCALTPNYTGEEAIEFINNWRSVTSWLLYEGGIAKKSPAELGIPKP